MSDTVLLASPNGEVAELDSMNAALAMKAGWSTPSPEQLATNQAQEDAFSAKQQEEDKYNTPGQYVKTVAEGAARGLTLSGSDWLENKVLGNAQDIKARQEKHPWLSFAAEAGAMLAPALVTGGETAAAQGALEGAETGGMLARGAKLFENVAHPLLGTVQESKTVANLAETATKADKISTGVSKLFSDAIGLTPMGLTLQGERAVVKGLTRELPATAGLLRRVTEAAVAEGAGQLITGGALGISHVVHENALGDPNYTAEALLANPKRIYGDGAEGALFGGALGALMGGGGKLIGTGVGKIIPTNIKERLADFIGSIEDRSNPIAAGGSAAEIKSVLNKKGKEAANELFREGRSMGLVETLNSTTKTAERADAIIAENGPKIASVVKDVDARVAQESGKVVSPDAPLSDKLPVEDLRTKIYDMATSLDKDPYKTSTVKLLMEDYARLAEKYPGGMSASDLWQERQFIGSRMRQVPGKTAVEDPYGFYDTLKARYGWFTDELKARMTPTELARFNDANHKCTVAYTFRDFATHAETLAASATDFSGMMGGGAFGEAVNAVAGSPLHGGLAGGLSAAAYYATKEQLAGIVGSTARVLREALEPKASVLGALAKNNEALKSRFQTDFKSILTEGTKAVARQSVLSDMNDVAKADELKRRKAQLTTAARPDVLAERLAQLTENWHHAAPNTSVATSMVADRAIGFLNIKLPKQAPPTTEEIMSGKSNWRPSSYQVEKFNRYYNAVIDPTTILPRLKAGRLTAEEVEAVSTVYPRLFKQMQASAMDALHHSGGKIPEKVQNGFRLVMATQADGAQVRMIQAVYNQQPGPQPNQTQAVKMSASSRLGLNPKQEL